MANKLAIEEMEPPNQTSNPTPPSEPIAGKVEELYRRIFAHGIEGIFQSTPDGRYLVANNALAHLYGYENPQELIEAMTNIGPQLYVQPGRREEFVRLMKENGVVSNFESEIYRRDGTTIWISENARAVSDSSGCPSYYEGTVQDITRRKLAEDGLRRSQRFIERVTDTSPAMLYVYDLESEKYIYVNHQVLKILGYSVEDFVGRSASLLADLVHPEDAHLFEERLRRLADAEEGQVFESSFRLKNADAEWIWVLCRDTVFTRTPNGVPEQILGMAQDMTERRRSREALEWSREQLRALTARLQMVQEEEWAAISREIHDELGQTLTALNMEISLLRGEVSRTSENTVTPRADELFASMTGLVDSMLRTVRRISTQLRPPVLDELGLADAIEWQAREFQKRYGIRAELIQEGSLEITNHKLSAAVFRIFQEILTNVARHARASKVRVLLRERADSLLLLVKDNGVGITTQQQSASLGVLGMQERAHIFGGKVRIEGAPGRGTTVTVELPLAAASLPDGRRGFTSPPKKETLGFAFLPPDDEPIEG